MVSPRKKSGLGGEEKMSKLVCVLLAAVMLCVFSAATAEETDDKAVTDPFSGVWVCPEDEDHTVEIWREDGEFFLLNTRFTEEEEFFVTFARCRYDAERNALLCEDGELRCDSLADTPETDEEEEPDEEPDDDEEPDEELGEDEDTGEIRASGFGAVLTIDGNGLLQWTGSGDAVADCAFVQWNLEDDGLFTGDWQDGDTDISILLYSGVYEVTVAKDVNENETAWWEYTCAMDAETGALTGTGSKYEDNAESDEMTEIYADGEAVFSLEDGVLLWNDAKEDAGQGMRFVRVPDDED